jgi:hypothetical protein
MTARTISAAHTHEGGARRTRRFYQWRADCRDRSVGCRGYVCGAARRVDRDRCGRDAVHPADGWLIQDRITET